MLIVDDNNVNRRVLGEQVSAWGMLSDGAASGNEALDAMRAAEKAGAPYRFAIVDHQMPQMDGVTLASRLKADPGLQNVIPVILSSVCRMAGATGPVGVEAWLVRPVRQSQLMNALVNAWDKRSCSGAPPPTADRRPTYVVLANSFAGSTMRVLVAEDTAVNQMVAVAQLQKLGLRADVAGNGLEAIQMFAMAPYDLVLMDCQMPEMDGYAATREIRRREGANAARSHHRDDGRCDGWRTGTVPGIRDG
ncbi:MAG: response regulator [Ignavibacteriota bacterium]